jgi:CubicO group peptidase (beta-lactamase class C family)
MRTRREFVLGAAATSALALRAPATRASDASPSFASAEQRAESLEQLHALVIANADDILFAKAFRGPPPDRPVNVKSVSKTIVALLTGIAIEQQVVPSVDATIAELAPELIPREADPAVAEIAVSDLLTMRAGLERTSGPNYGAWVESRDWIAHALSRPMVAEPGEEFLYSTGSYHILGAILAHRSRRSLLALAREWLGDPLGIDVAPWTRDPQGYFMGGNNMALAPTDLARIGQTVLADGVWSARTVVPPEWIAASWQPRARSPFSGDAYGYGWFLTQLDGEEVAYARGYGGQMLYVARDKGVVAAITSDSTLPARSHGYAGELKRLFAEEILPNVVT